MTIPESVTISDASTEPAWFVVTKTMFVFVVALDARVSPSRAWLSTCDRSTCCTESLRPRQTQRRAPFFSMNKASPWSGGHTPNTKLSPSTPAHLLLDTRSRRPGTCPRHSISPLSQTRHCMALHRASYLALGLPECGQDDPITEHCLQLVERHADMVVQHTHIDQSHM
jgi:hypothetical protein